MVSRLLKCGSKCRKNNFITSRAAVFSLLWACIVSVIFNYLLNLVPVRTTFVQEDQHFDTCWFLILNIIVTIIYCFYPLAGFLADVKLGRYRTISWSLHILAILLTVVLILYSLLSSFEVDIPLTFSRSSSFWVGMTVLAITGSFLVASVIAFFNANIIQFGVDQLHDSPVDQQSQFINWYFWTQMVGLLTVHINGYASHIFIRNIDINLMLFFIIVFLLAIFLIISLWISHCQRKWFLIDLTTDNPYKLVYDITKFAYKHKIPVKRSAFTYCEDEIPSGLNLGKSKYGGPYTTEEVEDVRAFYGILKVLFTMGPFFFIGVAADRVYENFYSHIPIHLNSNFYYNLANYYLLIKGLLSSLFIVIFIPLYMYLIRPFLFFYIPGMLKRIGLGFLLMILCLICLLVLDTMTHIEGNTTCMFQLTNTYNSSIENLRPQNMYFLSVPRILSSIYKFLVYIALYEFICSQSPHSMKGLLIGLSFAIQGVFELMGYSVEILFAQLPESQSIPSCGMIYFLINIVVGILSLPLYVFVARQYQRRFRDEPCLVRRYVEEYYSKLPKERLHNYSDHV